MNHILPWMTGLLCVALVAVAWLAVSGRSSAVAILASGLVGLLASLLFLILASPDVAMTEAAIGSGLTTFLFFFVLARVRDADESSGAPAPRSTNGGDRG